MITFKTLFNFFRYFHAQKRVGHVFSNFTRHLQPIRTKIVQINSFTLTTCSSPGQTTSPANTTSHFSCEKAQTFYFHALFACPLRICVFAAHGAIPFWHKSSGGGEQREREGETEGERETGERLGERGLLLLRCQTLTSPRKLRTTVRPECFPPAPKCCTCVTHNTNDKSWTPHSGRPDPLTRTLAPL